MGFFELPFIKISEDERNHWHTPTYQGERNKDSAYGDGNALGKKYAIAYLESLEGLAGSGALGWILRDMPWGIYNTDDDDDEDIVYQKGIMIGFFSEIESNAYYGSKLFKAHSGVA